MQNSIKKSFSINIKLMRILGWYPTETKSHLYSFLSYFPYMFFTILSTSCVLINMYTHKNYDIVHLIHVSETVCYCVKLLSFLRNRRQIKECINYFNGEEFAPKDETERDILKGGVKLCQGISVIYIINVACSVVLYILPALISSEYDLPLDMWLPYDPTDKPVIYYMTLIYTFLAFEYNGFVTSLLDPLMGGLAYQAAIQLKILKHRLQKLQILENENNTASDETNVYKNIIRCIQYHKAILKFVDKYESCFSWPIFCQISGTTCALGFCCFAFITIGSVLNVLFVFVALCQVLFYCYFGTLLYEESNTLTTAIYTTEWYEYDVPTKKLLIILMEKSKQPIILTSGKIVDLTLETFSIVLKRSYSLVAVFLK